MRSAVLIALTLALAPLVLAALPACSSTDGGGRGEEERRIRTDPAARVTELLRTVFGSR